MIGFIFAMKEEAAPFCKLCNVPVPHLLSPTRIQNPEGYIIVSGVGAVNATLAADILIYKYRCTRIINVGTAGSNKHKLFDILNIGTVLDKTAEYDGKGRTYKLLHRPPYSSQLVHTENGYTCCTVHTFGDSATGDCVDMELVGIVKACNYKGVPCASHKIITDCLSIDEFEENLDEASKILADHVFSLYRQL